MLTWLDLYPDRVAYEIAELEALGFTFDEAARETDQRLIARGPVTTARGEVELVVCYPDTFPFLRPEVFAPSLSLERHQNPYEGNLCLLDRNTRAWDVDNTGAWLVSERVPLLLELLEQGGEALRKAEAPQGEPASTYLRTQHGNVVLVPDSALAMDSDARTGHMKLSVGPFEDPSRALRLLLRSVTTRGERRPVELAAADDALKTRFSTGEVEGRWVRIDAAPASNSAEALLECALKAGKERVRQKRVRFGDRTIAITGVVLREEVLQEQWADSWTFIVEHERLVNGRREQGVFLVRGERYARTDLAARVPSLTTFPEKHVAILGLGALGAPLAMELARSGVGRLSMVDFDRVEAGNTVRWPIGTTAIGRRKIDAIVEWVAIEHPFTDARAVEMRIGDVGSFTVGERRADRSELDILVEMLGDADLVVDATAELGISHLISTLVTEKPIIFAWATEGAAGGAVARTVPGGACWTCLQHHLDNAGIQGPPRDPHATLQPRGCATTTFTGANFDLAPIVAQAARVVASTLNDDGSAEDINVMSLRDHDGTPLSAPSWTSEPLTVHPRCAACASRLADAA